MGIETTKTDVHWNYFLAIERDLEILSRYVEFDDRNFKCFSVEIARIILSASAEADVVCKLICRAANRNSDADGINAYRSEIAASIPSISSFQVLMPRFGLTLTPWHEWQQQNGVPLWWTAYNKIKHHRDSHYHEANLKNAVNAVSALFVVSLHLYKEKAESGTLLPSSQLFTVDMNHIKGRRMPGDPMYRL